MSWGWAKIQLLYTCAKAFHPPSHKPTHILNTLPLFDMFFITLEQRFPRFSTRRSVWSARQ